jgi:hypothetical protein
MGLNIESNDLNELKRIAIPGTAAPSLFWVVPIGRWHMRDLHQLLDLFTHETDLCNELGLLLVKGDQGAGRRFGGTAGASE